mmetsp:Transcript_122148/g.356640  ORF Transcript_122148/g.356640 Transcript_122148/m.356640 type:complete len:84 (-) Transcript_122148:89-340(-)
MGKITITVKQMTGEKADFEVEDSNTVSKLKEEMANMWHVPQDQLKVSFEGTKVEDGMTIAETGVKDGGQLGLFILSWTEVHGL